MPYDPTYAHLDRLQAPELRERRDELMTQARELSSSGELAGDDLKAFERLETEITEVQRRTEQLESLVRHARNPWNVESGDGTLVRDEQTGEWVPRDHNSPSGTRTRSPGPFGATGERTRDAALRTIERHQGALTAEASDRLERIVRNERFSFEARYLDAVGDPAYFSAFGKMVADPTTGHLRFTPEEVAAVQRVSAVEAQRAMGTGTGAAGGFAIPFTLDPSVMLSSNGVLNPVRQLSRAFPIATKEWKGVSSDGVTAAYIAEATEAADASPTLAQPTITTVRGQAFIPFSIELGMDWASLESELLRLIADGKDVLESGATGFLSGTGAAANALVGLLAIGTTGSLTTTQRIQSDVAATLDVDDIWDLAGNVRNLRFAAGATFVAQGGMFDRIYRFTPAGSTTEPQAMPTREGPLCGYPKAEWSSMVNTTTTGSKVAVLGDFSNYLIADRIGMTAELIPHLFGATSRFPTGQRGLFAYWRTGTVVAVANGFRYLEVL